MPEMALELLTLLDKLQASPAAMVMTNQYIHITEIGNQVSFQSYQMLQNKSRHIKGRLHKKGKNKFLPICDFWQFSIGNPAAAFPASLEILPHNQNLQKFFYNFIFQIVYILERLFDVNLACESSQMQAHKVIVSAFNPFFLVISVAKLFY